MLTHWDPEMYPSRPIPPLAEIVINLLAYGHVVLKDVDLFMNETIVSHLSEKRHSETALGQNWEILASLPLGAGSSVTKGLVGNSNDTGAGHWALF